MGIEYTSEVGYGFILDKKAPGLEDVDIMDVHELAHEKVTMDHWILSVVGDLMGDEIQLALFLNDISTQSFSPTSGDVAKVVSFDNGIEIIDDAKRELEELSAFFEFDKDNPSVIAAFSVG